MMDRNKLRIWFSIISVILILFGVLYCFSGLKIFVRTGLLPDNKDLLIDWESALYGAIMIGWGATLFLLGRLAFQRQDKELLKVLLFGILLWLIVEAAFSLYLGVYFNAGVDVGVMVIFAFPVMKAIRNTEKKEN